MQESIITEKPAKTKYAVSHLSEYKKQKSLPSKYSTGW